MTWIRRLLNRMDAPWYVWLLVPVLAVGYLAKKETQWMPDEAQRRKWARRIFFGSIALALLIAYFRPARREASLPPPASNAAP